MNLLITSSESRKSFDVFNILRSRLDEIYLSSNLGIIKRLILSLIYLSWVRKTNDILNDIKEKKIDIKILPIEEVDIELIYKLGLEAHTAIPSKESFYRVVDKVSLHEHAISHKVPCPKTLEISQLDDFEIEGPIVLKPKRGMGSEGIKFFNFLDDAKCYIKTLSNPDDVFIQEIISLEKNVKAGSFLFDKGKLITFYGHERLRTFPERGGVTINSISNDDRRIMELGEKLLGPLNWTGIAMVEFMWSERLNDYQLIEINPRVWGSIMLSEKCCSNLLGNYLNLIFENPTINSLGKNGFYVKWLIPYDIINIVLGKVNISEYFSADKKNICLVNISYTNYFRSLLFHLFQFTQLQKIFSKFFA